MVNKVAVIAIVAILAVPILIGFGMNLEPTTKTEYIQDKDPVIVTDLLKNSTDYSFTHADIYKLNSDMSNRYGGTVSPITPTFNSITNNKSSYNVQYLSINNLGNNAYAPFNLMDIQIRYDVSTINVSVYFTYKDNGQTLTTSTYQHVTHIYFDRNMDNLLVLTLKPYPDTTPTIVEINNINLIQGYYTITGGTAVFEMYRYQADGSTTTYADISKGYYFKTYDVEDTFSINLPERTSSALMTIDLDSITNNNFNMSMGIPGTGGNFSIRKNTSGGVVSWEITKGSQHIPLYYDPSRSDNTYQIKFDFRFVKTYTPIAGPDQKQYDLNVEFRYVGGWPTAIGEANYYQKYNLNISLTRNVSDPEEYMNRINLSYPSIYVGRTPTVRMDDAFFAGFEYPVIRDNQYDPTAFKSNPSTVIKNITQYGDSIIFAGETYTVGSDGNITLGTRSVSLNGIVFDSVPVAGGYDNRINGYVISTTAQPSTINFKGAWVANISTDSQSINTYQTTVWHAGEFAWGGMDQNFLIVGLITSLAVFVGLGIYARKSNSKGVIPLMIVCGCAATLFFIML